MKGLSREEEEILIPTDCIFLGYRGSISHGLFVPSTDPNSIDDKDVMGVYISPIDHYLGMKQEKDVREKWYNEWDCVYYEVRKLLGLLLKGNPNVMSLLWLDDEFKIKTSPEWGTVLTNRDAFISKQAYHSFYGYAKSQFYRMEHAEFSGYMGTKRKELVKKYGYDCKNASHLIRLLKMCIEFLTEGKLYVKRTSDASELLSIKRGEWTLKRVKQRAEELFGLCEIAYIHSTLPNEPDYERVNKLCLDITTFRLELQ